MSTSLADASDARKARLLALRSKKQGDESAGAVSLLSNRNFDPESRTLRKRGKDDTEMEDTVENSIKGAAENIIKEDEERRQQELDVFNIAPKRANWDLKRDMAKKTAKLERRTQEAIHMLIRQRLAAQKGESTDIVEAMKAQERANENDSDEED